MKRFHGLTCVNVLNVEVPRFLTVSQNFSGLQSGTLILSLTTKIDLASVKFLNCVAEDELDHY